MKSLLLATGSWSSSRVGPSLYFNEQVTSLIIFLNIRNWYDYTAHFILKFLNKELWPQFSTLESRIESSWPQMKHNHRLKLILFFWWKTEYLLVFWILRLFGSYYWTLTQTQNRVWIILIIMIESVYHVSKQISLHFLSKNSWKLICANEQCSEFSCCLAVEFTFDLAFLFFSLWLP